MDGKTGEFSFLYQVVLVNRNLVLYTICSINLGRPLADCRAPATSNFSLQEITELHYSNLHLREGILKRSQIE